MLTAVKVDLIAASSLYHLIMVGSRCSENDLAAASGYYFLLAMVLLKHLKYTQKST